MDTKVVPTEDLEVVSLEEHEFDIECDIASLSMEVTGLPNCPGEPARWVAWRVNCCPNGPRYRLVGDHCKSVYQRWQACQASIVCLHCGTETGGFAHFTELNKKS